MARKQMTLTTPSMRAGSRATVGAGGALLLAIGVACGWIGCAEAQIRNYVEAPMLSQKVRAGSLPPVEQRLPLDPFVVTPHQRAGVYGGAWRVGVLGSGDGTGLLRMVGYDGMMSWRPDWSETTPNIASRVDVNATGSEYVFHLRKGMKWSDGEPFTAEDVVFGMLDLTLNKELQPLLPAWYRPGGEAPEIVALDPSTVRFRFKSGMSLFLDYLSTAEGQEVGLYQKRYCSQLLPKHNPNADAEAKAAGFPSWVERVIQRCGRRERSERWSEANRPTLNAWVVEKPYVAGATEVVLVRNPYYWKVDTEGRQLPYLDRVVATIAPNVEKLTLLAMNGEIDMQDRHIGSRQNRRILDVAKSRGNFRFYELTPSASNTAVISFNGNHADPKLRQVFGSKDFRIGVSHAIDRQAIIQLIYQGASSAAQVGPPPGSPLHNAALSSQYLDHDLAKARAAFDRTPGLRRAENGRYTFDDGSPLAATIDVVAAVYPEAVNILDMIRTDLAKLGFDLRINQLDRLTFTLRYEANNFDAQVWGGDGGLDPILVPRWYFPSDDESRWAPLWALWYIDRENPRAETPPAPVREQMELYQALLRSPKLGDRLNLMGQILEITRNQFPVIGISLPEKGYGIVRNDFHNVPDQMPFAWSYPNPGPARPEQFFSTRGAD